MSKEHLELRIDPYKAQKAYLKKIFERIEDSEWALSLTKALEAFFDKKNQNSSEEN